MCNEELKGNILAVYVKCNVVFICIMFVPAWLF